MTKRDYVLLASVLRSVARINKVSAAVCAVVAAELAVELQKDNPRFEVDKFMKEFVHG